MAQDQLVLPRFATLKGNVLLWSLAALTLALLGLVWSARLPIRASGPAIVVRSPADAATAPRMVTVAVFLSADVQTHLRSGLAVRLRFDTTSEDIQAVVSSVTPRILAPAEARATFGLDSGAGAYITSPSVVALVRLDAAALHASADTLLGSIGRADVQIGSRRVLELLPVIGGLFHSEAA